jgi:hypothetical protein
MDIVVKNIVVISLKIRERKMKSEKQIVRLLQKYENRKETLENKMKKEYLKIDCNSVKLGCFDYQINELILLIGVLLNILE